MRIPRKEESEEGVINLSSLLDVMFILIIFFLATATFKQMEFDIPVNLPVAGRPAPISDAPRLIPITVQASGAYVVGDRVMSLAELKTAIGEAVQRHPEQRVLVRADSDALHGMVAAAIASCRQAGVLHANIGYQEEVQ